MDEVDDEEEFGRTEVFCEEESNDGNVWSTEEDWVEQVGVTVSVLRCSVLLQLWPYERRISRPRTWPSDSFKLELSVASCLYSVFTSVGLEPFNWSSFFLKNRFGSLSGLSKPPKVSARLGKIGYTNVSLWCSPALLTLRFRLQPETYKLCTIFKATICTI